MQPRRFLNYFEAQAPDSGTPSSGSTIQRLHYSLQLRRIRIFPHVSNPDYLAFQHIKGSSQHNVILFTHRRQNRSRGRLLRHVKHRHRIRIPIARMQLQAAGSQRRPHRLGDLRMPLQDACVSALIFSKAALKPRISLMGMVYGNHCFSKYPSKVIRFA